MGLPGALARVVRLLAPLLVWVGAGIAGLLTIATVTVDRIGGQPIDLAVALGAAATLAFAVALPLVMRWPRFKGLRRWIAVCLLATLLVFVTRPEGVIGGSVALVGGAIGVLRHL